nr:MAG TPA: hypothetical protein [Bacteriophage sp.]
MLICIQRLGKDLRTKTKGEITMKYISINNGNTYSTAREIIDEILENNLWNAVVEMMDDETRETVAAELAPCTEEEFLNRYLEIAPADLIIG